MKKIFFAGMILAFSTICFAQQTTQAEPVLYGMVSKSKLMATPYDKWSVVNYEGYHPDAEIVRSIRQLDAKGISIDIFLGTWCGDSRREVPRFLKVLDGIAFPEKNVRIITMGSSDSLYKQSPQHEEKDKGIFRVPVFIVYKNGVEINRINEFPAFSLERDLYAILNKEHYEPNYRSFALIQSWLENRVLLDKNSSPNGLATQLKNLSGGERELNSIGYLLLNHGRKEEALKIFQINAILYPESSMILSSLGEGYYKTGDTKNAVRLLERSLELNKDPQLVKPILNVLYQVKGVVE
jgi:thiol-disulfide isomerase/thioredoxin